MPDFAFKAMSPDGGQRSDGTLTANSEREVMSILDARGLFPLEIAMVKNAAVGGDSGKKVKSKHMTTFYSQLADLLRAGVPLLRSLEILERQASQPALSEILKEIHVKVADGSSLAEAMSGYPRTFNELAVSMVRAGQEGGFLEDVLERIAVFTEHQEDLKSKVVGAMAYPIFLLAFGLVVLNVLVIFFVPKFEPIFKRLQERNEMPVITTWLLALSGVMRSYGWLVVLGIIGGVWGLRQWARTEGGRFAIDRFRLRMPLVGKIYLALALSRFTRILGTLLRNGIPILQALKIAKDSTRQQSARPGDRRGRRERDRRGNSLAKPLRGCPIFHPISSKWSPSARKATSWRRCCSISRTRWKSERRASWSCSFACSSR
ncbi:MAG: type II secretion system F family protein [Gemmataceae bacterium]